MRILDLYFQPAQLAAIRGMNRQQRRGKSIGWNRGIGELQDKRGRRQHAADGERAYRRRRRDHSQHRQPSRHAAHSLSSADGRTINQRHVLADS